MKLYKSIGNLPIANFIEIQKTNNLNYLRKDIDFFDILEITDNISNEYAETWLKLIYEFDEIDCKLEQLQAYILYLKISLLIAQNNENISEANKLINKIRIKELELKRKINSKIANENNFNDFDAEVSIIEKWLGQAIDAYKMSVKRYFNHRKNYQKYIDINENKTANKQF